MSSRWPRKPRPVSLQVSWLSLSLCTAALIVDRHWATEPPFPLLPLHALTHSSCFRPTFSHLLFSLLCHDHHRLSTVSLKQSKLPLIRRNSFGSSFFISVFFFFVFPALFPFVASSSTVASPPRQRQFLSASQAELSPVQNDSLVTGAIWLHWRPTLAGVSEEIS